MSRRGSTGPARPAAVPGAFYEARNEEISVNGLVVDFVGEDGRSYTFDIAKLPLPGWHASVAEAWARRIGPSGELRTLASAKGGWDSLSHFFRYLDGVSEPPQRPEDLRERHATGYRDTIDEPTKRYKRLHSLAILLDKAPLSGRR